MPYAPDVSCVEEDGSLQVAEDRHAVFEIGHQFHVAVAQQVEELFFFNAKIREGSRADVAHGEGTDTVGASHIELLAVGGIFAVAVVEYDAAIDMAHKA